MGIRSVGVFFACTVAIAACSSAGENEIAFGSPLPARTEAADDWVLVYGDDFEGSTLDTSVWHALTGDLVHKHTLNSASPSMATVDKGNLVVSAVPTPEDPAFPYTAGYLETRGRFAQTYGKIEFRARGAYAPGLWYAVWGRPWESAVPEIDIEFLAENINQAWFVNHWGLPPAPADERRSFVTVGGIDITHFHTYAIVWKPDLVEWRIDGKPYMRVTGEGVPREPVLWVTNAWVGGWAGTPSKNTVFPARFEIDSFRVYRQQEWPVAPSIRVANRQTNYGPDETIDVWLADFERSARVEVWEGSELLATLSTAPFELAAKNLARGAHTLTIVGTDGTRTATTSLTTTIR